MLATIALLVGFGAGVVVGALATLAFAARAERGRRDQLVEDGPTVHYKCGPCNGRPFDTFDEAHEHAQEVHNAPDVQATRDIVDEVRG